MVDSRVQIINGIAIIRKHNIMRNCWCTFYCLIVGVLAVMTLTVSSCSTDTVYDSYSHTPLAGWEKNDTLVFCVPKVAESGLYNQYIGVRMTNAFPFTSISLIVEQQILPKGKVFADTIKCAITDVRGNFLGDGVSSYQYLVPLHSERLAKGDSIRLKIRHNMKREILPGVSDVGIKISKN